ncbi:hypothetical protein C8046_06555 [Serinibacter arcticus]|uniref:Uncharacterized protein n=1 Tax=Serinibacter arcticus TaxID=1655435 RepID=A0A2U1ZTQ4_9MICO|nr:hypothetical protein [Serinibacter arcticus]PWD50365.1 hypothetical protein C8046_06555 [Serinibacter arcticus]
MLDRVGALVQTAYRRQWWLLLLDDEGAQLPVLPQVEMPPHLGEMQVERLAEALVELLHDGVGLVLVWEEPSLPELTDLEDLPGPSMVAAAVARTGHALRAQVVVRRGHRVALWTPPTPAGRAG